MESSGSPPRGRGKGANAHRAERTAGITPAWAGKSSLPGLQLLSGQDHPRVGGEKYAGRRHRGDLKGSPPRGRGKGQLHPWAAFHAGITPAWAGKSTWAPSFKDLLQDHPRVGGEKQKTGFSGLCYVGSPPRGRGKVPDAGFDLHISRITPAWAGKSQNFNGETDVIVDHPRVGGEKTKKIP